MDESLLGDVALGFLGPPAIWFIRCTGFQDAIGDSGNVACDSVARIVFGNSTGQEIVVIFPYRVLTADSCHGGRFVDSLQHVIVWCRAASVAAPAAELFMLDQAAVAQVVGSFPEPVCVDDDGNNLDRRDDADAGDRQKHLE